LYCLDDQAARGAVAVMVSEKAEEGFLDRVAKDVVSGAGNEPRTPAVTQYLHSAAIYGLLLIFSSKSDSQADPLEA